MLIRARRIGRIAGRAKTGQQDIQQVANEFSPARDEMAVEYQMLVAAREATSREMVPEQYRTSVAGRAEPADRSARSRSYGKIQELRRTRC